MKVNPKWATTGFLAAASLMRLCKKNATDFVRIQSATLYLKGVEVVRDLFLYQLGVLICAIFLVFGVILIQGAVIFYLPMSVESKASTGLLLGVLDSLVALGALFYFSSSARWLRQARKYHVFLEEFLDEIENPQPRRSKNSAREKEE